ncbi:hypothetical protein AALO_G00260860, partial [Alosa alosa]
FVFSIFFIESFIREKNNNIIIKPKLIPSSTDVQKRLTTDHQMCDTSNARPCPPPHRKHMSTTNPNRKLQSETTTKTTTK